MLRVLTLSTLFPDASRPNFGVFVERQTLGLAEHHDVDLRVIAPIGLPPWPLSRASRYAALAALPDREVWKGVDIWRPRFVNIPATGGRFHARALASKLVPLLTRMRREFPFDVIDASFFFPDGPAAVSLGKTFGVPVSVKARGADIHHWGHAPVTGREVIATGQRADGLLAVSQAMKADMVALGMPEALIKVHHTGVDLERFAPRDQAAAKAAFGVSGPLVVSVGALIPRKGHDIVIDAIAALDDVTLLVAGEGPERARLTAQIARTGAGSRIRLLGSVPHERIPVLFAAADIMALASASEGLANAWVEALASGTPLVIPDAGGAREVVTDPVAGRVVARNASSVSAAISSLLADPPARSDVRALANGFTWQTNRDSLYGHLRALVEQRQAAQSRADISLVTSSFDP
jgi:teichuronic acid biosynthesis glycosyltransferase TuaC